MSLQVIGIGSDNLVRLDALQFQSTANYADAATVTFTLQDSTGATVGSLSNVSMPYVSGSNGRYEGNIPASTALTENALYTLLITAVSGGYTLYRKVSCIAKYRSEW